MNEVELKFLDINVDETIQKIESLGAIKKFDTTVITHNLKKEGIHASDSSQQHLRIRQIDDSVELTYKDPIDIESEMAVRNELQITTSDFQKTLSIFQKLGFLVEQPLTKKRIHYELGDIHFELDTVSDFPTFLEIETQSEEAMVDICQKMNLDVSTGLKGSIDEILERLNN